MRHAVLGAGGVGTFLGASLARAGREVLVLMREQSLARYAGVLQVESAFVGNFEVDVPAAAALERPVDALWVTTKAMQLAEALDRIRADVSVVVPLLNGLDHVELLRRRFGSAAVLPAAIAIESERVEPGRVRQVSPFAFVEVSPGAQAEALLDELATAGFATAIGDSEAGVLWRKLSILAPLALTTTLRGSAFGGVMADPAWWGRLEACLLEVVAVARAKGVELDAKSILARIETVPSDFRTSMQKDREAGRPTEVDAIGGSVLRAAARHGIEAPVTEELVEGIRASEPN
jgi:2-dehydropantoate 2-reductase